MFNLRSLFSVLLLAILTAGCGRSSPGTALPATATPLPATLTPDRPNPTTTFPPQPSATPLPPTPIPPSPLLSAPEYPTYPGEALPIPAQPITSGNAAALELLGLWGAGQARGLEYAPGGGSLALVYTNGMQLFEPPGSSTPRLFRTDGLTTGVAFASSGRLLATGVQDGRVIFWNSQNAIQLLESFSGGSPVHSLAFSPGDRLLAAGLENGSILLFNSGDGGLEATIETQAWEIDDLAFIPLDDGRALLAAKTSAQTGSSPAGAEIGLWLLQGGPLQGNPLQTSLAGVLSGHSDEIASLAFCSACQQADGSLLLASSARDSSVRLWRLALQGERVSGESSSLEMPAQAGQIYGLSFSPQAAQPGLGVLLAGGSDSGYTHLWSLDGMMIAEAGPTESEQNPPAVRFTAFEPPSGQASSPQDELTLSALAEDGSMQFFSVPGLALLERLDAPHMAYGNVLAFSPDGASLATARSPGDALQDEWPLMAHQPLTLAGWEAPFEAIQQRSALQQPSDTSPVSLWQLADGGLIQTFRLDQPAVFYELAFSPDGRLLAPALASSQVPVWQAGEAGEGAMQVSPLLTLELEAGAANAVAFSPDSRTLAISSAEAVMLYHALSGASTGLLEDQNGSVEALAYSPDGMLLAVGGWSEQVQVWDAASQTLLATLEGHSGAVLDLKFSPDGRWLASGAADHTILLWEIQAILGGAPPAPASLINAHDDAIFSLAFSPDGGLLASASLDRSLRLWALPPAGDLPQSSAWQPLITLKGFEGMPGSLAFSPDGLYLAAAAWDGMLRLWGLPPE